MDNNCCVCLNSFLSLYPLSKKDDNETALMEKLQINVPQIQWIAGYQICEPCINLLNIVHTFRETCLKSDVQRQQQLNNSIKSKENRIVKSDNYLVRIEPNIKTEGNFLENNDDGVDDNTDDTDYEKDPDCKIDIEEEPHNIVDPLEIIEDESKPTKRRKKQISKLHCDEESKPRRRKKLVSKFQCDKCFMNFPSSTYLIKHSISEHDMNVKEVRPFVCLRCNRRFGNSSNLLQHIKYHEAVRSNVCSYCGKGFITKTDLNIHEKQHMNKREYECSICGKSFNTHKDLRSHKLVVHTDPQTWKFSCEFCYKRFPIKSNYDCHMRRHTGDKNFQCHLCDRKFTDKCVLQRHMRTHSNVREFKCTECSKEYKDKRVLQIHMAKVHEIGVGEIKLPSKERKYICHMCPKAYYAKNKLTRHLYTHTGEKPFFCTICDKKFNDKSYVKQHMRKTHNIDNSCNR